MEGICPSFTKDALTDMLSTPAQSKTTQRNFDVPTFTFEGIIHQNNLINF